MFNLGNKSEGHNECCGFLFADMPLGVMRCVWESDYKLNLGGSWKSLISKNDTFQD